jgi:adenylate cyclase
VVEILTRHRATVDEFQGDGILAFFGAPLAAPDDAARAVACAIEMQRALVEINVEQRRLGLPELEMGIGINTGEVVVGNIGSEQRTKYGAVGAAINVAYRIESQTVGGQVLLGPRTYELVREIVDIRGTLDVKLKGVETSLTIYDVVGIGGAYDVTLPTRIDAALRALDPPWPCHCYRIDGKRVSDVPIEGRVTAVSPTAARVSLPEALDVREPIRMVLRAADGTALPDVYAKVVEVDPTVADVSMRLVFTSVPPEVKPLFSP